MAEQFQRVVAVIDEQDAVVIGGDGQPEKVTTHARRVYLKSVEARG
jgi:hypothetical protein